MKLSRRVRVVVFVGIALILWALALACGISGTAVPECRDSGSSEACSACCSDQGYTGHAFNSLGDPPCECM